MNRRELMTAFVALGALTPAGAWAAPAGLRQAAREAWLYGLPLIEVAGASKRGFGIGAKPGGALGKLNHNPNLAGPEMRAVTTPNNDTLYSATMIDLSAGPATIDLPATGSRYFSLAFMDFYTNNFAILGTRTTGSEGGTFTLVGPAGATNNTAAIRSPTPWVWMLARVLVDGPEDLAAARAVQNAIGLKVAAQRPLPTFADRDAPWPAYFDSVQALMLLNPPPATDLGFFRRIAALGLKPRGGFDAKRFSAAEQAEIEAGVADAKAFMATRAITKVESGWVYPPADLGDFGQDYVTRAVVAKFGLAALTVVEAMYMRAISPEGTSVFDSGKAWRLHFPAGQTPPVNAFWSLSMYELSADRQLFFTENPIRRYSIGDRTQGLKKNADGSLDIWIGRADPGGDRTSNWLPAPAKGEFSLTLRAYLAKPELADGRYRLPPVTPA